MSAIRYFLLPVVPVYYVVAKVRNKLFDKGFFKSKSYDIPTICIGNLTVGGTGKTPMVEYLIRMLKDDYRIATLSRGYKRNTDGFILADESCSAETIGDEPFQFFTKFDDILVSVDADRPNGVEKLMALEEPPELILLDDAFQHRKLKAKLNILLTPLNDLYIHEIMLPTGDLREPISGADRADIIVVTKCVRRMSIGEKQEIVKSLKIKPHQQVFFSSVVYSYHIKNYQEERPLDSLTGKSFTLVTGIANAKPLVDYLKLKGLNFEHLNYQDHHQFDDNEIEMLKNRPLILTTEKDYMRLQTHFADNESLFYLPIEINIHNAAGFEALIRAKTAKM